MFVNVNGIRLFFDTIGEKLVPEGRQMRERPTVLLLHGGPGFDHSMFRPDFDVLAEVAQIVALDHRGNGRSEHGDPALWTLAQWGDDVRAFCDTLGIEKPIVLGYSFGGFVAQSYAVRHPGHAGKLIFYSTAPVLEEAPQLAMFEQLGGARARAAAATHFAAPTPETLAVFRSICFPLYNTRAGDPGAKRRTILNDAISVEFFRHEAPRMDFRPLLHRIECPTLILSGALDPRCPVELAQTIATAIRPELVRMEIFENSGHGTHIDDPERTMAVLRQFILQ